MEILAGNMDNYISRMGIQAQKTYESADRRYQVWEINDKEFKKLVKTEEESYEFGEWWRSAKGSNMGRVNAEFMINGQKIKAWELMEENRRQYNNILDYFEQLGATMERNICALAIDLAKQNNKKLSKLLTETLG